MPRYWTVKLPCKPYIKKYVETLYGFNIKAGHSTPLGVFLLASVGRKSYDKHSFGNTFLYENMTEEILMQVSNFHRKQLGSKLIKDEIIMINSYLEQSFQKDLYYHCQLFMQHYPKASGRDMGIKDAIYSFAERFGLEIDGTMKDGKMDFKDISYEGLKRMEWRYRSKLEAQKQKKAAVPELF